MLYWKYSASSSFVEKTWGRSYVQTLLLYLRIRRRTSMQVISYVIVGSFLMFFRRKKMKHYVFNMASLNAKKVFQLYGVWFCLQYYFILSRLFSDYEMVSVFSDVPINIIYLHYLGMSWFDEFNINIFIVSISQDLTPHVILTSNPVTLSPMNYTAVWARKQWYWL